MIPFLMGVIASAARQVVTPPVAPATSTAAASSYDRYFRETSLLLHGDGVDGAQVVTDSSLRVKVPTVNGAVAIDTDQSKYGGSSIFFPGTASDYLEYTRDADYDFGTGDFTIEFWVRLSGYSPGYAGVYRACIAANYRGGGAALSGWQVGIDGTASSFTGINVYTGTTTLTFAQSFSLNTWYHVAICRASGTVRAFVDGVLIGSVANSDNFTAASDIAHPLRIGRLYDSTYIFPLNGHLDDFRITKGVARYTSGFVPARCADIVPDDPYWSSVVALYHMDGHQGTINFIDSCRNPKVATRYGDAILSYAQKKFGYSSAYFDGTGDYIDLGSSSDLALGTQDFTVEFWVQFTAVGAIRRLITSTLGAFTANSFSVRLAASNRIYAYAGGAVGITGTTAITTGVWYHIAAVRRAGVLYLYVDGVLQGQEASATNLTEFVRYIGGNYSVGPTEFHSGYIDDLRITAGVARYTSAFTPPADRHPDIVKADPYFTSVAMHLPFEGADGATTTLDESMIRKSVTFNGNAQIDTGYYKYGVSSCLLDGTGDYVALSGTPADWKFLHDGSRWTYEGWFRFTDVANSPVLISTTATTVDIGMGVYVTTGRQISVQIYRGVSSTYVVNGVTTGTIPNDSSFHHIAVCYDHTPATGNCLVFIDGALAGTFNKTANAPSASNPTYTAWVGAFPSHPTLGNMNGSVDSIRITKGVCRYTSAFAVPLDTHPMYKLLDAPDAYFRNTSALLHLDSYNNSVAFVDSSLRKKAFTASGDAKHTTSLSRYGTSCLALDGTGDYISTPYNSEFDFSTGDFTIELWYRPAVGNVDQQLVTYGLPSVATGADLGFGICHFGASVSGKIRGFFYSSTTAYSVDSLMTLTVGTWYHIALVRANGQMRLYIDGMLQGTVAAAPAINSNASYTLRIGYYHGTDTRYVNGHIDDLRITKAVCRYATDFIPERCYDIVVADPYWSSNTLMLHMDGPDGMARVYDSAYNPKPTILYGGAVLSTVQSKFGGTSLMFDGNGDYAGITSDSSMLLGTQDFTIEFWMRVAGAGDNQFCHVLQNRDGTNNGLVFQYNRTTQALNVGNETGALTALVTADGAILDNVWYHIAFTRYGNTYLLFVNGVQVGSQTVAGLNFNSNLWYLSRRYASDGAWHYFNGHLDDLRVTVGYARYIAAFVPPAAKHPDIVDGDPYYTSVVALFPFDRVTLLADKSLVPLTVTANGDSAVSVAQSKFGGGALYLDGTGDYLVLADSPTLDLSGDFTIDLWARPATFDGASGANRTMLSFAGATLAAATPALFFGATGFANTGKPWLYGSADILASTTTCVVDTWHHIALVREGTTITFYVDGVAAGSTTFSTTITPAQILIGRSTNTAGDFSGYLDDIRITKGVARRFTTLPTEAIAYV